MWKNKQLFLLVLISSLGFSYIPLGFCAETVYSPSANDGDWFFAANAYASDDARAIVARDEDTHFYRDYDISIVGDEVIDKVEIGIEHYASGAAEGIEVHVSWDGGNLHYAAMFHNEAPEILEYLDLTGITDWTAEKLHNDNFFFRVGYEASGGGCFGNDMRVRMSDWELETIKGLSKGDKILDEEFKQGVIAQYDEFEEDHDLPFHNVTLTDGRVLIIYGEHEICISRDYLDRKLVRELTLDDQLLDISGEMIGITSIEVILIRDCANIMVSGKGLFWCEDILVHNIIKEQWTGYLDWLPVRITTSLPGVAFFMGPVWYGMMFFFFLVGFIFYLAGVHK